VSVVNGCKDGLVLHVVGALRWYYDLLSFNWYHSEDVAIYCYILIPIHIYWLRL